MKIKFLLFLMLMISCELLAQEDKTAVYEVMQHARSVAIEEKNIDQAIDIVKHELIDYPQNQELNKLLLSFYRWNGDRTSITSHVKKQLQENPEDRDYRIELINLYEVETDFNGSLLEIKEALSLFPNDNYLQFRKAYALSNLDSIDQSIKILKQLLSDRKNPDARYLLWQLKKSEAKNFIAFNNLNLLGYGDVPHVSFYSLEYGRKFKEFTLVAKANSTRLSENPGFDFGLIGYYSIDKTSYGHLGINYSKSTYFPKYRLNGSYFKAFSSQVEISLSSSLIKTNPGTVKIITPSFSKGFRKLYMRSALNYVLREDGSELTYKIVLSSNFGVLGNIFSVYFGSIPSEEIVNINASNLDNFTAKYLGAELKYRINYTAIINLNYNRNISTNVEVRDQFNLALQQSF